MTASLTSTATGLLWFLDTLVSVRVAHDDGADGISVLECHASFGHSPPLHVHHSEDEVFEVLDGELRVRLGDDEIHLVAGDVRLAPKGLPHTFRVESDEGARWRVTTTQGDFERFVRTVSRPATSAELPPPAGAPTPDQAVELAAAALAHEIELLGPPLS